MFSQLTPHPSSSFIVLASSFTPHFILTPLSAPASPGSWSSSSPQLSDSPPRSLTSSTFGELRKWAKVVPSSSGLLLLRGILWVSQCRRPGIISIFVAISQSYELPGSHFPGWESTLTRPSLFRCPLLSLFDHIHFLETKKFQAAFVLLLALVEE